MEEKSVALVMLCVVVIIAIVGLVLIFASTASARVQAPYPGGVIYQSAVTESPGMPIQQYRTPLEVEPAMPDYTPPYYQTVSGR